MNAPTAYPLQWPAGWPRTQSRQPWAGRSAPPALAPALKELQDELRRLGASGIVLSSNVTLGNDRPADPGVVAYCVYDKMSIAIPCDRWNSVAGNCRAIALTIEAMRGMERWGAKHMIRAMFQGFTALPAAGPGQRHWRAVFGAGDGPIAREWITVRHRELARSLHPDAGGTDAQMAELNAARDQALAEVA